jgi:hypothetical protein
MKVENQTKFRAWEDSSLCPETSATNAVQEFYLQRKPEENHLRQRWLREKKEVKREQEKKKEEEKQHKLIIETQTLKDGKVRSQMPRNGYFWRHLKSNQCLL